MPDFEPTEAWALARDRACPSQRELFHIPRRRNDAGGGEEWIYLCGNSLGLQPKTAGQYVREELEDWANLAVEGHFHARRPWYPYHERLREAGARLVGALPHEVVYMNGLTVNLHLMMVSLYRPTRQRFRIVIEDCAFPSDMYAVQSQLRWHGFDPADGLIVLRPRPGEQTLRTGDIEATLARAGPSIALVLLAGVNYFTGQVFDIPRITAAARRQGSIAGWDLAHAAGNVELRLHDWDVDFAAWCNYKYLNGGPGAVAGCFLHERHARDTSLPRFGGWWGNDPATRFRMHLEPEFRPVTSADAWQLSNPPILALAPVLASLEVFDRVGMAALRARSQELTGYLQFLLDRMPSERYSVITPCEPEARGAQLSIQARERPRELYERLEKSGVICDFREPNVIRVAPAPLYNTFHEVWRFAGVLRQHVS